MLFKRKIRKIVVLTSAFFLLSSSMSFADINVTRIAGKDRYDTAMKVTQRYFNNSSGNLAIIASGSDFRTALYGSYMANALKVPYYVIPNSGLSKSMMNELSRLNIKRAYVMGDYRTLNRSIDNSLKSIGIRISRFYDKYEYGYFNAIYNYIDTPIFETFFYGEPRGDISNGVIINDKKFPDLLASIPFLSELTRKQATFLGSYQDFDAHSGFRFIIGGYNTVPDYVETFEDDYSGLNLHSWSDDDSSSFYTGRISGENRYETAVNIADAYTDVLNKDIKTVVLVDGTKYPDALASGTVSTLTSGTVLLTEPNKLNENTRNYIQENDIKRVIIIGGESSVSKKVESQLKELDY